MFFSLEECADAWEKAGEHGTKKERIERNLRWIPFYSYVAEAQRNHKAGSDSYAKEVAGILKDSGVLNENETLLDLGCGTGSFALAFAEQGTCVTAVDMDELSLQVLKLRAEACAMSNIDTKKAMWECYEPEEQFDIVFSSMCPAICDYDELLRFEAMGKKYGCLIAVTRGSYDKHRKQLMQELNVQPSGGMTTEAIWYYNMLYLMGRQPNVRSFTQHHEFRVPIDTLVEQNKVYFEIFGISADESEAKLKEYYEHHAVDGMIEDESCIKTQLIWWEIPKEYNKK